MGGGPLILFRPGAVVAEEGEDEVVVFVGDVDLVAIEELVHLDEVVAAARETRVVVNTFCFIYLLAEMLGVSPAAVADNDLLAGEPISHRAEREHAILADVRISLPS